MSLGECITGGTISAEDCNTMNTEKFRVKFKLTDGTEKELTFEEYMSFVIYNKMLPSDCDIFEYSRKVMAIRL